jgi:ABC-type Mn2+/Zn2+ transport system ATPase subunit
LWNNRSLDFSLESGRLNIIRGNNGIGKSILAEIISRRRALDRHGSVVWCPDCYANQIAFLPQHLTGIDDISISGLRKLFDGSKTTDTSFLSPNIERWAKEGKRLGHLSGGQRRLFLGLMTVGLQAEMTVLDEPIAGLDKESEFRMTKAIEQLVVSERLVIAFTHEQDWYMAATAIDVEEIHLGGDKGV